jgi:hypothetical protein
MYSKKAAAVAAFFGRSGMCLFTVLNLERFLRKNLSKFKTRQRVSASNGAPENAVLRSFAVNKTLNNLRGC